MLARACTCAPADEDGDRQRFKKKKIEGRRVKKIRSTLRLGMAFPKKTLKLRSDSHTSARSYASLQGTYWPSFIKLHRNSRGFSPKKENHERWVFFFLNVRLLLFLRYLTTTTTPTTPTTTATTFTTVEMSRYLIQTTCIPHRCNCAAVAMNMLAS